MIATPTTSQNYEKKNWFFIIVVVKVIKEHNYSDQIKKNWKNNWGFPPWCHCKR
jgi:hypothetical protein